MMNSITDEIVVQINDGDENAFEKLYKAYYGYLTAIGIYYINDENAVSEIVNDVFVNVWYKRSTLTYPVKGYLANSVQNACISYLRAQNTRQRVLNEHIEQAITIHENIIRSLPQPMQDFLFQELITELKKAGEKLPLQCKIIFKKYFLQGQEISVIAGEMGIQEATVRVQIKNARERIKELIKHMYP